MLSHVPNLSPLRDGDSNRIYSYNATTLSTHRCKKGDEFRIDFHTFSYINPNKVHQINKHKARPASNTLGCVPHRAHFAYRRQSDKKFANGWCDEIPAAAPRLPTSFCANLALLSSGKGLLIVVFQVPVLQLEVVRCPPSGESLLFHQVTLHKRAKKTEKKYNIYIHFVSNQE